MKLPSFHFGKSWTRALYGRKGGDPSKLPKGQSASLAASSDCTLSLSQLGALDIDLKGKYSLGISPEAPLLGEVELFKRDNFIVLQFLDGDIGVSRTKEVTKHFFTLTKPLPTPKFSLKLKVSDWVL